MRACLYVRMNSRHYFKCFQPSCFLFIRVHFMFLLKMHFTPAIIAEYGQFEAKIDQLRRDMMSGGVVSYGAPRKELFVRYC